MPKQPNGKFDPTGEDAERIKIALAAGTPLRKIAAQYGVSAPTISRWARRNGVSLHYENIEAAQTARRATYEQERAELQRETLAMARRLVTMMGAETIKATEVSMHRDGLDVKNYERALGTADMKNLAIAFGIVADKVAVLEAAGDKAGDEDGRAAVLTLVDAIKAKAQ